jgi:protein SCO1/2
MRTAFLPLLGMLLVFAACSQQPSQPLHGMQLVPAPHAANFQLTDQNGQRFAFEQTRGRAVALYFGFTHCKDTCPQTLALLGKARQIAGLSPAQLRIVMVSVDGRRDTPAALRAFFEKVGVNATGLTGDPRELQRVYKAYGIAVMRQKRDIAHTDTIFLIDPSGRIVETLVPESALKDVAADMRAVVE